MKIANGLIAVWTIAGMALAAAETVPLGSPDFQPSPAHPLGWRGDGTGRYPGATPPLTWRRAIKSPLNQLTIQIEKPTVEPKAVETPISSIVLKDWMILGPLDVPDGFKALDETTLPDEANLAGDAGAAVGTAKWQAGTTALGELFDKVAYAHTYIYSPEAFSVRLDPVNECGGMRLWLNGKPVYERNVGDRGTLTANLEKGWNRLLVKLARPKLPCKNFKGGKWVFSLRMLAVAPLIYESKNIAWAVRFPGGGWCESGVSTPVIVGDRLFLICQPSDLVCFDAKTGKLLWIQPNNYFEALNAAPVKEPASLITDNLEFANKLKSFNDKCIETLNALISPIGVPAERRTEVATVLKEKWAAEMLVYNAFQKSDPKKYNPQQPLDGWGCAGGTPVTDGEFIYVWFVTGVVACYDLNGQRQWITRIDEHGLGGHHHGCFSSPAISGKVLICALGGGDDPGQIQAIDLKTGAPMWRQPGPKGISYTSINAARVDDEDAVILRDGQALRAADGKLLWASMLKQGTGIATPVIVDGVFCHNAEAKGIYVSHLPQRAADATAFLSASPLPPARTAIASSPSPLLYDGLIYAVEDNGGLRVAAATTPPTLVFDKAGVVPSQISYSSWPGVAASPTAAGGNIYIVGNSGQTVVLKPGREFKEIGRNQIVNLPNGSQDEQFISCPVFQGKRLYLRGSEYLYCIEEE